MRPMHSLYRYAHFLAAGLRRQLEEASESDNNNILSSYFAVLAISTEPLSVRPHL